MYAIVFCHLKKTNTHKIEMRRIDFIVLKKKYYNRILEKNMCQ
jgi:hypothetical protein